MELEVTTNSKYNQQGVKGTEHNLQGLKELSTINRGVKELSTINRGLKELSTINRGMKKTVLVISSDPSPKVGHVRFTEVPVNVF